MGDENRGQHFAQFIVKRYPKVRKVLCVADGKGQVARKLANKGIFCHIIENSPRWDGRIHPNVSYEKGFFLGDQTPIPNDIDLIIGMHPDEATSEIVIAAKRLGLPFVICPCCIVGRHANGISNFAQWLKKLKSLWYNPLLVHEFRLKMKGKNIVLYTLR